MFKKLLNIPILKNKKVIYIILTICILLIIYIAFNGFVSTTNSNNSTENNAINYTDEYVLSQETRLQNMLLNLKGVTNAKVYISTSTSVEIVYAYDTTKEQSANDVVNMTESIVYNKDGSTTNAVIVVKKYPKIEGVLIVVGGVEDEKTKLIIENAISTVLDININKVQVLVGD